MENGSSVVYCRESEAVHCVSALPNPVHVPNFGGLSGSEDRGGGDNSIQFINIGRVGDKCFKEW